MKRIYLIRHAKSSWKHKIDDLYRPLKKRGVEDAILVAKHTKQLFSLPDLIVCSPSKRTMQTSEIFVKHWCMELIPFDIKEKLYDFSGDQLIKTIHECDDSVNNLMIFAHNFAVTDFVNTFGTIDINSVPTCGFTVIDFQITSWKDLTKGCTVYSVFPKHLKYGTTETSIYK